MLERYHIMIKNQNSLLNNPLSSATLNLSAVEELYEIMTKEKQVKKVHPYKIYFRKDGRPFTKVEKKGTLQQLTGKDEKEIYLKLYDFYFGYKRISLEKLFPEFMLYRRNRGKVSSKTLAENKNCWNRFLAGSDIVKKPICDITVKEYINFFEDLTKYGDYTAKCIGNLKSLLNKMYDYAIREEIVEHNPVKDVDFKEFNYFVPFNDDKVYKNEDRIKLLIHLEHKNEPYALAIRLMFQLTVRIGELKSFRWDDVDFDDRTIRISKQALTNRSLNNDLSFSKRETIVVNHTKKNTPQGKRKLRLTSEAIKILELAKEINPDGEYIFMPHGKLMLTDTFNEHLKKYCNECNIPYYSSHKIRFTSASNLYNGKNLTQVSRALGHSQVATTLHYFRNVDCDDDLLEQMEEAFSVRQKGP